VRVALEATMDENDMKYVNPFVPSGVDVDMDDAADEMDTSIDIITHDKSDDMIERLGSLHSRALFHDCTVLLSGDNTLRMNKLIVCMMSAIIRFKCTTGIGNAQSNIFDMTDVSLPELQILTGIVFRKSTRMHASTLDTLIFIADEYEFHAFICNKLWKTMYAHELSIGQLYINRIPEGFNPQKPITLDMNGTLLNVRQIVPLLLHKIPVMVKERPIGLGSLKWNTKALINGRSYGVEYVEVAQMLAGLDPSAMGPGYAPRGEAMFQVSRDTVAKVAYDLIEYGIALSEKMNPVPETYFNPTPAYRVTARGIEMNARRLVPFIINSMYASFVLNERLSGDRRSSIDPQNIRHRGTDSQWTLEEPWVNEITDPDTKLYFAIARLAFAKQSPKKMPADVRALYEQTLNGEKQGFYNPMWDLVSFGTWLAHNERSQFILS
jgi:hypothetical protein